MTRATKIRKDILGVTQGIYEAHSKTKSTTRILYPKLGSSFFLRNGKRRTDGTAIGYRIKKVEDSSRIINNWGTCFASVNYDRGGVR